MPLKGTGGLVQVVGSSVGKVLFGGGGGGSERRTADGGLFVLLKVIVHEAEDEG